MSPVAAMLFASAAAAAAGCKQKSPPPPAPEAPGTTKLVVRDPKGAAEATFVPIGSGEWEVTPAGRTPMFVRLQGNEYRTIDATGETLAHATQSVSPKTWVLYDADDKAVATVQQYGGKAGWGLIPMVEESGPPGRPGKEPTPGYTLDYEGGPPPLLLVGIATDTSLPLEQRALLVALSMKSR